MINIDFDSTELAEGLARVGRRLAVNIPVALEIGADLVVAEAKTNHDYTDQTGQLTNSIALEEVSGTFESGTLQAVVGAGAPHAAPIEFGSRPHTIEPKHRRTLRFPVEGGFVFAKSVAHPGNREYAFVAGALQRTAPQIAVVVEGAVVASFAEAGFR